MADIVLPQRPALAVIPDVPLVDAGENWPLITDGVENGTFTSDDIAAAIAALDDPSIRSPRIKLGHSLKAAKAMGDGGGTWGRVPELWTKNDGMTLTGHFVGVPIWLAEIMPSAWASRSIEGRRNVVSDTGKTHALVIDAVSLLGETFPAISTLDEVRAVWGARTLEELPFTLQEVTMPTTKAARPPVALAAGTTTEDIRRAYYDQLDGPQSWWWIREMELDPLTLIVDDDEGGLWRVAVTISGEDISFAAPEPVRVEYVPVAAGATTSASRAETGAIVFASRTESRQGVDLDPKELRKSMGLAETATDAEVLAKAAELAARPEPTSTGTTETATTGTGDQGSTTTTPPGPPASTTAPSTQPATGTQAPVTPPPGFTLVADAVLDEIKQGAAQGVAAAQTLAKQAEDAFIARHRARIGPTSNPHASRTEEHLRREWQRNQGEAEAFAASLPERMPTTPRGFDAAPDGDGTADQFDSIVRSVWPTVAAVRAERERKG